MKNFVHFLIYFIVGLVGLFAALEIICVTAFQIILCLIGKEIIGAVTMIILFIIEIFVINWFLLSYHGE